jgi:hypothetical protein
MRKLNILIASTLILIVAQSMGCRIIKQNSVVQTDSGPGFSGQFDVPEGLQKVGGTGLASLAAKNEFGVWRSFFSRVNFQNSVSNLVFDRDSTGQSLLVGDKLYEISLTISDSNGAAIYRGAGTVSPLIMRAEVVPLSLSLQCIHQICMAEDLQVIPVRAPSASPSPKISQDFTIDDPSNMYNQTRTKSPSPTASKSPQPSIEPSPSRSPANSDDTDGILGDTGWWLNGQ